MYARKIAVFLVVLVAAASRADAPEPPPTRAFDVASVEPNNSGDFRRSIGPGPGGRFQALNNTLRELVTYAYGADMARAGLQIAGGPSWMDRERVDVDAVAQGGALTPAESRDARLGARLRASTIDCDARRAAARRGGPPPPATGAPPNPRRSVPSAGCVRCPHALPATR
jgi:hypothetical protein